MMPELGQVFLILALLLAAVQAVVPLIGAQDGKDSNGWHDDNEKELGKNPFIASVSLGAERVFHLQHNTIKEANIKLNLEHGSLLLMKGETQHFWKRQIPKTAKIVGPRINLTFRIIN